MPAETKRSPVKSPAKGASAAFSVLGEGVTVTGNVVADGDLHLEGRVEGDVKCGTLVLGESGHVAGAIDAQEARIAGEVSGSITADNLTIEKSARTSGDISYTRINMEAGAK
ncbi:MAG: polymer-forming cytoskeletal protein, partial [Pseudomonadota bacterium]